MEITSNKKKLAFENIRIVPGNSNRPIENGKILIYKNHIGPVGASGDFGEWDSDTQVIDGYGHTLMPGLIDAHAGILGMLHQELIFGQSPENIASSTIRAINNCALCISKGITTIRVEICGHHGTFGLKDSLSKGEFIGPRLFVFGKSISVTGGHAWDHGSYQADGVYGIAKAVRDQIKSGADWIKIFVSGGAGSPTERLIDLQVTKDEILSVVKEAHQRGKYVSANASSKDAIQLCIDSQVDSIEHGHMLDSITAKNMSRTGIYFCPNLGVYRKLVERGEIGEVPEFMYHKAMDIVDKHREAFRCAYNGAVKIVAGTESGSDWYPITEGIFYELETMVEEGMSNIKAIRSATYDTAKMLRIDSEFGTVESEKIADLLIVKGNPLRNIRDLRNTKVVIKNGEAVVL